MTWHHAILRSLERFDDEAIPSVPPEHLPLIDELRQAFPQRAPFAGFDALFIQHQLGAFVPHLEAMLDDGLDPGRCWFVDIPYSTNLQVRSFLWQKGYREAQTTRLFGDPLEDYSSSQSLRVGFLLQKMANRPDPKPLLVVDDGAYFLRYLTSLKMHQPDLLKQFNGARVVEQTTRGHRYITGPGAEVIKLCDLHVVSIARCHTKLQFEAPFIGAAVSRALLRAVGRDRLAALRRIGIIGYGAVGKATVAALLKHAGHAAIDVVDIEAQAREDASKAGPLCRGVTELQDSGEYELVAGCTGYTSFKLEQRRLLADDALLASGSSAAVEFNRTGFIELADQFPDDDIEILEREKAIQEGIHATIRIRQEGRKVFSFVNAGFPVNFDGRIEVLPARVIQATHSLLYQAACQAATQASAGVRQIEGRTDHWIYNHALEHL